MGNKAEYLVTVAIFVFMVGCTLIYKAAPRLHHRYRVTQQALASPIP